MARIKKQAKSGPIAIYFRKGHCTFSMFYWLSGCDESHPLRKTKTTARFVRGPLNPGLLHGGIHPPCFNRQQVLIHLRLKRAGEFGREEEAAGLRGHKCRWNPHIGAVSQCHPEAHPLPLHATPKLALRAADDLVRA